MRTFLGAFLDILWCYTYWKSYHQNAYPGIKMLKDVWVGGLRHLFWLHIWNLQGLLPLVWNFRQSPSNHCRDIAPYRRVAKAVWETFIWWIPLSGWHSLVTPEARLYWYNINWKDNFVESEGWLRPKLPTTGIRMMKSVTNLPSHKCASCCKNLKIPNFALREIGVWLAYVIFSEGFPKFRFSVPILLCAC